MPNENEPVKEDPNIVIGGPDGGPAPEKQPETPEAPAEKKPLYQGFTGEITTPEDLVKYTQTLETMVVAAREKQQAQPATFTAPPPPAQHSAAKETFEDLIYSDPARAKQILKQEWQQEMANKEAQQQREKSFWDDFYKKNVDLKELGHVVQSVFKRDRAEIGDPRRFPNNDSVAEYLAKEARSLVGLVKAKTGGTETKLEPTPAVTFSGSGEPGAARPAKLEKLDFAGQILRLKKGRG